MKFSNSRLTADHHRIIKEISLVPGATDFFAHMSRQSVNQGSVIWTPEINAGCVIGDNNAYNRVVEMIQAAQKGELD